jgi:ATP-binding cassette, subfamily B, multidrug efflux pump
VAQRISTVLTADKIVVLDGGRKQVALGKHNDLVKSSPLYREICLSSWGWCRNCGKTATTRTWGEVTA